jgi:K+-transporting ATPase ATPase C chain
MRTLAISLRMSLVTLLLTGILYPVVTTGLAQLLFPHQANGSMLTDARGVVVGSALLGQRFEAAAYFQPRPSAAGEHGYDANASGGSNLSVTSKKLHERVQADLARLQAANPDASGPVPADLLSASGSGLDPDISPEAARWEAPRVAKARGVELVRVLALVEQHTDGRELGFLGEPRVNVLALDLALDAQFGRPAK